VAAGLEHLEIHPRSLRHCTGHSLVNRGVDIRVIQGFLGHRSTTSATRYAALNGQQYAKLF
jgi:integrase/recombinase XerD